MNARFGKHMVVLLVIFGAGAIYGAYWEHGSQTDIKALGPATNEELAQVRAGMAKPARMLVSVPTRTNVDPALSR